MYANGNRAVVPHPCDGRARVEAAGEREADTLTFGEGKKNVFCHDFRPKNTVNRADCARNKTYFPDLSIFGDDTADR